VVEVRWCEQRGAYGYEVDITAEGREAYYEKKHYPLYGTHGAYNYVGRCVHFVRRGPWINITSMVVRDGWGGTGSEVCSEYSVRCGEAEKYLDPAWVAGEIERRGVARLVEEVLACYYREDDEEE
jgi:hypothetical protein